MEVKVHESSEQVANAVASLVSESIEASDKGFTLGLAGGSTPEATYRLLGDLVIPWESVTAWMTDERWVGPDSGQSNGRMAAETLFDEIPANLIRPEYDPDAGPEWSSRRYEANLRDLFEHVEPDLALLGMGSDGHTASLFPGSPALAEQHRWYVENTIPETGEPRLTATYPLLNRVRKIVLIVVGGGKAEALRESFNGATPAGRLADAQGEVVWHVDKAAAQLL